MSSSTRASWTTLVRTRGTSPRWARTEKRRNRHELIYVLDDLRCEISLVFWRIGAVWFVWRRVSSQDPWVVDDDVWSRVMKDAPLERDLCKSARVQGMAPNKRPIQAGASPKASRGWSSIGEPSVCSQTSSIHHLFIIFISILFDCLMCRALRCSWPVEEVWP